jgi:CBS domain-containing protein
MRTEFHALSPDDSLAQAAELLLRGGQAVFPILEDGRVAGMLTKPDIVRGLSRHGDRAPIATAMRPDVPVVDAADMLDEAYQRLQGSPSAVAAVTDRGRFVGLLAADTFDDFVSLQAARRPQG